MNYYWMHLVFARVARAAGLADVMSLGWLTGLVEEEEEAMTMSVQESTVLFGSPKLTAAHRFLLSAIEILIKMKKNHFNFLNCTPI